VIRALVFDFDGLLVDTETVALRSWEQTLADAGVPMPYELWHGAVGGQGSQAMMSAYLSETVGPTGARALWDRWWTRHLALAGVEPVRPGVEAYLTEAGRRGLALAVASSATGGWVNGHVSRLGLMSTFAAIVTGDTHRPKPAPDTYLAALAALGIPAAEAIAFEDSPTGVAAACTAGLRVVAVPNAVTATLRFPGASLVLPSLDALSLPDLLDRLDRPASGLVRTEPVRTEAVRAEPGHPVG
jgi:HAD superfamily hydrolase (TIGR01509 family)